MPFAQRLTCTIDDACEVTGLGRTKLYELIGAGRIVTTTIGRRRLDDRFHETGIEKPTSMELEGCW
jgi:excisionase family DNA binding protein